MTSETQIDSVFKALAHSKRRGMLNELSFRPATVKQLADSHRLSLPAIHKHIRLLEEAGLIERRKSGRTNFVALNAKTLGKAQGWINQFHTEWGSGKETLDNYIAGLKD